MTITFKLGSCLDLLKLVNGNINMVLTDPPYGIGYQSHRRKILHEKIGGDATADDAMKLIDNALELMMPKLAPDAHVYIFFDWKFSQALCDVVDSKGLKIKGQLIWVKNNHGSGDLISGHAPRYESILHAIQGRPRLTPRIDNVLFANKVATKRHPTEKPVDLLKQLISVATRPGELVVDPFAGVASTLKACKELDRSGFGCEIDPQYYNIGHDRLCQNKL